jgi:hypothetical protein
MGEPLINENGSIMATLFEQINAVDLTGFTGTDSEVGKGEHVVGVMSPELRGIQYLYHAALSEGSALSDSLVKIVQEHGKLHEKCLVDAVACRKFHTDIDAVNKQILTAKKKSEALRDLFWNGCRVEFPELGGKNSIGVRTGFQVVWMEDEDGPGSTEDLFKTLAAILTSRH